MHVEQNTESEDAGYGCNAGGDSGLLIEYLRSATTAASSVATGGSVASPFCLKS
jgi:hypothetical protein